MAHNYAALKWSGKISPTDENEAANQLSHSRPCRGEDNPVWCYPVYLILEASHAPHDWICMRLFITIFYTKYRQ